MNLNLRMCCSLLAAAWLGGVLHADDSEKFREFDSDNLKQGRLIWIENCMTCHGYGVAGAPIPLEPKAWSPRLDKGMDMLYQHALEGFFGPDDTMMPPRGGNEKLTDSEVRLAVDYMTAVARDSIETSK